MALQVWLPLTKDLRQQGLSDATVTNSGATYSSTGGKLGGCYSFDGTDDAIGVGNLSTIVDTDFSWSCWFYRSEWSSKSWETIFGGPSGFELETKNGSTNSPLMYAYSWGKGTFTYELNQWNHLVMTRTASETKFYLNGELKLTGSAGSIPSGNYFVGSWSSTTGQNFKGKVNDVRIYDHCLSEMEVKELAKGLILHYPLNRQSWGQDNLIINSNDFTKWTKESVGKVTLENDGFYHITSTTTNSVRYGIYYDFTFPEVGTYTLSALVKTEWHIGFSAASSFVWTSQTIGGTGDEQIVSKTVTTTSENNKCRIYLWGTNDTSGNVVTSNYIKWMKIEEGSIATPWCPNSADSLYSTLGLDGTTEYDCSGFCNNGTRMGTFDWISDTPKYSVSTTAVGGASTYLEGPILPAEAQTAALWIKSKKSQNAAIFNDKTSGLQIGLLNSLLYMNSKASTAGFTTTHWIDDEWNHVVVTYDGTTRKAYINGQPETQSGASNYYIHNADNCWLWNRSYNNNYPFYGSLSDFRIYATALSADDVKSLYQNCATIDSDGTIRGQIRS